VLDAEVFAAPSTLELQGPPAIVRVDPGGTAVVRVRFESPEQTVFAAGARVLTRSALDYQDVAGSLAERVRVCRPTGAGCDDASVNESPLPEHANPPRVVPARGVLDRDPL
jgi:hypothetical protein